MNNLPPWATTPIARALIDELLTNPPETRVRPENIMGPREEVFTGKPFCMLKRLHHEWFEKELHALDAQFAVTGKWCDDAAKALHRTEDATALVKRLLAERGEERAAA